MRISVRISGRWVGQEARHSLALDLQTGATVDDALDAVRRALGNAPPLAPTALLAVSSTHVGTVAHHGCAQLEHADELFLFAPVGGG